MRLVLASGDGDADMIGTTYPVSGGDLKQIEALASRAIAAEHRIWAPFEDGRREWYELPRHPELIAEVAVTTLDSGVLRQPARFVRWRIREPLSNHQV